MALKATIFKADIDLADMDRHVYLNHAVTMARHPSETDQRMMLRLLAWALKANERLEFTRGLCADDEPELWQKSYSDEIELWIELGLPDETRIKKATARAEQVLLLAYNERSARVWWQKMQPKFAKQHNLEVIFIADESAQALAELAARTMQLSLTINEGEIGISDGQSFVSITPSTWQAARA